MTTLRIKTMWFWRKGEGSPELLQAWDEYSVDANPDGFAEACDDSYAKVRDDDGRSGPRYIDVVLDREPIDRAFQPVEVDGRVRE